MRSRVALYGLALALLCAAAPSRAERLSDREYCFGEEQKLPFPRFIPTNETTIAGCTRLINGGRLDADDQLNALFRRADAFRRLKQYARAIADYNRMLALGDHRTDRIYYNRGITYYLMGRNAEAIRDLQGVAQSTDPRVAEAARKALQEIADSPKPGTQPPPAHAPGASHVDEIRRKANAREQENGFCATVPWPILSWEQIAGFFDRSAAGSVLLDRSDHYCQASQFVSVGNSSGDRCVRVQAWNCEVGKECKMTFNSWCKRGADYSDENCRCQ